MARKHREPNSRREDRRRDSNGDLLPQSRPTSKDQRKHQRDRRGKSRSALRNEDPNASQSTATALSADALSQLDALNDKLGWTQYDGAHKKRVVEEESYDDFEDQRRRREQRERREREGRWAARGEDREQRRKGRKSRIVSGEKLERGKRSFEEKDVVFEHRSRHKPGPLTESEDYDEEARRRKRKRRIYILIGVLLLVLIIAIAVGVVVAKKKESVDSPTGLASGTTQPSNSELDGVSESSIPSSAQGTYLDPFTWYDTTDFNVTYTAATVGDLSVMGLNSTWDDNVRANDNVPALNSTWEYGTRPVRGVNLGGWLSIEPLITPSFFDSYTTHDNVIDEWTLSSKLGASKAKAMLEQHYSSFVTEQTFAEIQAAGFDHIRIPFSYWAVTTYDGDPYVPLVSWRYLLRAIEWARNHGIRINLDLHGAPGSQNGWNHSGRQGVIGWLNGTDGALNGQRTLDIHNQLSQFFAQDRYKNIIAFYGLVNEPRMVELDVDTVLTWTTSAISTIRNNNLNCTLVFGDGFLGLDNWQGRLAGESNLLLDVHQYVIFNVEQIVLDHSQKLNFACAGWTAQMVASQNTATGFGPTLCGEWSQADTDCATYLNNVGVGSRWEGTLNMVDTPGGSTNGSVLTPTCPTANDPRCECDPANADPASYSAVYKQWLLQFAEAQMQSFEQGWGWFYWTWQTETATQWSYRDGLAAGILPSLAYERSFNCSSIADFASLGLPEYY